MSMRYKSILYAFLLFCMSLSLPLPSYSQSTEKPEASPAPKRLTLFGAVMCEKTEDQRPFNEAIVFSIKLGHVYCFTAFDPVPQETFIYHRWYSEDKLRTKVRLTVKPPRWSTFSRVRMRTADRGPWRVEVTDKQGNIFRTLRFSITD